MDGVVLTITVCKEADLPKVMEASNNYMRAWTHAAARGECSWTCADCCSTFPRGMPDECDHGHAGCTAIIQRDKREAMREGNEPI